MEDMKCLSGPVKCILMMIFLIYIISPIDFLPEILLGPIGLIDDLGAVFALLMTATGGDIKKFGKMFDSFK